MRKRSILVLLFVFAINDILSAQGGKAEPKRIRFETGRASVTIVGSLRNAQEMEYIFAASRGQSVTIKNPNRNLFDFRVFSEEFGFETEFESSPVLTFEIPETGDYMFFVRKKQVRSPRAARFSLTLAIR